MTPTYLTRGQEGMWRIHRGLGDAPVPSWMLQQLTVDFDASRAVLPAEDALAEVVRRHEGLRTTVGTDPAGTPVQIVHDDAHVPVEAVDSAPEGFGKAKRALLDRLAQERFDLAAHPPVRAGLVRCGGRRALVLLFHHIATDQWSLRLLHDELLEALTRGRVERPYPMQPGDVAAKESSPEGRRRNEQALRYLQQCHDRAPQALFVEGGRDDAAHFTSTYLHAPAAFAAARALAARHAATEPAVWLAALSLHLSLATGLDRCRFHMQVSNRTDRAEHTVVGRMARSVPLAVDLSGGPDFPALARRALRATMGAMRNAGFSNRQYEDVVRAAERRRGIRFRDQVFVNYLPGTPAPPGAGDAGDRISGTAFTRPAGHGPTCELSVVSEKEALVLAVDRRYVEDPEAVVHWLDDTLRHLADTGGTCLDALPAPAPVQPAAGLTRCDGCWISLPEIAAALADHPGVRSAEAAVRAEGGREVLVARVHTASGVSAEELRDHMAERLPRRSTLMVPGEFVLRPGSASPVT
ncbi:condensation domain-containing protein [Actinacidiphila epipremni]|uniref:Condensation domain-containing protein n=1 Tax=Actinacidiphila epipremni TaxID=2053013 RepID=A0ABX0ZIB3_9ACTN|nr:condensation domain-containing protein [Actinacidiphila epipremni]NJP43563.1 hypothetical protein [Actinacidiphila epipremni]